MSLTVCTDTSPADWITAGTAAWHRLVAFGPSGFPAYARLRYLPDPSYENQSENDAEDEGDEVHEWRAGQWAAMFQILAAHTATGDDCYICIWDGYGDRGPTPSTYPERNKTGGAVAKMPLRYSDDPAHPTSWSPAPVPPRRQPKIPKVVVPNRAYFLFHTSVSTAGAWDSSVELWVDDVRLRAPELAFVWPADHAWCVAFDVDPHWAGIGADTRVIDLMVDDPRLDAVRADPAIDQPRYR